MRRTALPLVLLLVLTLGDQSAGAATRNVSIVDHSSDIGAFTPRGVGAAQGDTVSWRNDSSSVPHTTTGNPRLSLWNSGNLNPGEKFPFVFTTAGTYRYHCAIHPSMTGSVRVPIYAAPSSGPVGTRFAIRVSSVAAAAPFVYDIQRKVGTYGTWALWKTVTNARGASFTPNDDGTYFFRGRLRDTGKNPDAYSGWSRARSVTVTAA